jgi:ATP synthase protein I
MSAVTKSVVKDNVTLVRLLIVQLIFFSAVSLLLFIINSDWFLPSLCGGFSAWLPNIVFAILTQHTLNHPVSSATSGAFMLAWVLKLIVTVILMIVAIQLFKTEFIPLGLGFLSVIMMQFLAPIVVSITSK